MNDRRKDPNITEKALEKAAKLICTLKCGVCPVRGKGFSGLSAALR